MGDTTADLAVEQLPGDGVSADVVIVGAGPGGAALALVLARRGVSVALLERRKNFAREFRGEVLMPSGIDALAQCGLGSAITDLPGAWQNKIHLHLGDREMFAGELDRAAMPVRAVSQSALLEHLVAQAEQHSNFTFVRGAAVKELMRNASGRITGVRYTLDGQAQQLRATLVIGADGRNSLVRKDIGATPIETSPPMDIVWCKVPKPQGWEGIQAYAGRGHLLVAYHSWDDMLQIGWVILKGTFGELRARGVREWVAQMSAYVPAELANHLRANEAAIERPFLLDVVSDCVTQWSVPGALLIGDAAHTVSPVGGQGINLALRDAIVTANHLLPLFDREQGAHPLLLDDALKAIEQERLPEITTIQALQEQPPRLLLNRGWLGEPMRWVAARLLDKPLVQARAGQRVGVFLHGVTQVRLES